MKQSTTQPVVRTRFAPSPTGYLHIGGARTALFSWLYARQHHGTFILRIEDTDRLRSTNEAIQAILEGLEWLGIDFDEGPYFQTERLDRYSEVIAQLLKQDKAYRCNCSKERLTELRDQQLAQKQKPRYDGLCRDRGLTEQQGACVIRFRNPLQGEVSFVDLIRGQITVNNNELDDLIIARSDGMPTYNFTVVVDDWDMQISQVIRGDDHINNTPRQINMFAALGINPPQYAHVPMILGSDGKRLSKRHGAVSVLQYREEGYLPEALVNYLVRLGWAHGDQEIFSREQMIEHFNIKNVQRAPAAFNLDKLLWLNQQYLKMLDAEIVARPFARHLQKKQVCFEHGPHLAEVVKVQAERCKTLEEMVIRSEFFFTNMVAYDDTAQRKFFKRDILPALIHVRERLLTLEEWLTTDIHSIIVAAAEQHALSLGQLAQPIRIAVTGGTISPPLDATLYLLGRDQACQRLDQAIAWIDKNS